MAAGYARRKFTPVYYWSRIFAGLIVLFPLSIHHLEFRGVFSHGLAVSPNRASPAYAAFEDLREDYESDATFPSATRELRQDDGIADSVVAARSAYSVREESLGGLVIHRPVPPPEVVAAPVVLASAVPARTERAVPESTYHIDPRDDLYSVGGVYPRALAGAAPPAVVELAAVVPDVNGNRPLWLDGQIEMTGGLAFVGPETPIRLNRVVDGKTYESGRIWVHDGRFEIHVGNTVGRLVAELSTRDGRVLGRGELNLVQLRDIPPKANRIGDLRIALHPTAEAAVVRPVTDVAASDPRVELPYDAEPRLAREDGFVSEPSLEPGSTYLVRARARKHWPSLAVSRSGSPQDVRLLPTSMVRALISLSLSGGERTEAERMGIIWGQVRRGDRPVVGARVELAGDFHPIYFNDAYLPDPSLTVTGSNGLFAFLRVPQGVQSARVTADGHLYPGHVFMTEDGHVANLDLELRDHIVSQFKVVDPFRLGAPVTARVRPVGTDAYLTVTREGFAQFAVAGQTFMMEADAGSEFEPVRLTGAGEPHAIVIPAIRREWLLGLSRQRGVAVNALRGTVVGFVDDRDFEIEMTGTGSAEVIYFDAQGQPVPGSSGPAGGGFAIFNAPQGLQTVYVRPIGARSSYSEIVVAEPEFVHVLTWPHSR